MFAQAALRHGEENAQHRALQGHVALKGVDPGVTHRFGASCLLGNVNGGSNYIYSYERRM